MTSATQPPVIEAAGVTAGVRKESPERFTIKLAFSLICSAHRFVPISVVVVVGGTNLESKEQVTRRLTEPCGTWARSSTVSPPGTGFEVETFAGYPPLEEREPGSPAEVQFSPQWEVSPGEYPFLYQVLGPGGVIAQAPHTVHVLPERRVVQGSPEYQSECVERGRVRYTAEGQGYCVLAATVKYYQGWPSPKARAQVALALLGKPSVYARGVSFTVSCQAPASERCEGDGTLSSTARTGKHPSLTRLTTGKATFSVGAAQSEPVLVPINRTARKLLGRSHRLPVTLTVTLTNSAGGPSIVATRTLVILSLYTARIARSIEHAILTQRHIHAKVTCPAIVIQKKGNNFRCIATTYTGKGKHRTREQTPFAVTQENDEGYVTYVGE
jgi:hypothetical protein